MKINGKFNLKRNCHLYSCICLMPSTCLAVEVLLIKSGYHNPGYFVFAGINYISDCCHAITTAAWTPFCHFMQPIRVLIELCEGMESGKPPDSWEQIEVMEPISWLLVCLEREAEVELFTKLVWKVETVFSLPEHSL